MLLPVSLLGDNCSQVEPILDGIGKNEKQLLKLENDFPNCVKINIVLFNYYKEKKIWKSSLEQGLKIKNFYPNDDILNDELDEINENIPLKIIDEDDLMEAKMDIDKRSNAGVKHLRPMVPQIKFDFDSFYLDDFDKKELDKFARMLKKSGENNRLKYHYMIKGHTDNIGTYEYNIELSRKRANAVKNYLINVHRINPNKLKAEGSGPNEPLSTNLTKEGRRDNRRVQFDGYLTAR